MWRSLRDPARVQMFSLLLTASDRIIAATEWRAAVTVFHTEDRLSVEGNDVKLIIANALSHFR